MFDINNYFETSSQVINKLKDHKEQVYSIAQKIIQCKNLGNKISQTNWYVKELKIQKISNLEKNELKINDLA